MPAPWPFGKPPPAAPSNPLIEEAKGLNGSLVACIGPSGCGKTDLAVRLSLACAYFAGIPWYGYDSNGDVAIHMNGIRKFHVESYHALKDRTDPAGVDEREKHQKRLAFLARCRDSAHCYGGPSKLPQLMADVERWITDGVKEAHDAQQRKPRCVVFIDEAGAVRDRDELFWPRMRQARNAGLTLYTTGHRVRDWHPAALAIVRVAVLWKNALDNKYDIGGAVVKNAVLAEPKSDKITYIIGGNPSVHVWDRAKDPKYPPRLIVPAQPTSGRSVGF